MKQVVANYPNQDKQKPEHWNFKIFGDVHGVGFRWSAKKQAESLGLTGFVKNLPDGTVYAEAEGQFAVLEKFQSWCERGPSYSSTSKVEIMPGEMKAFSSFEILD